MRTKWVCRIAIIAKDTVESEFTKTDDRESEGGEGVGRCPAPLPTTSPEKGKGWQGSYFGVTETFTRNWLPGL
jgi:hypothetical protein